MFDESRFEIISGLWICELNTICGLFFLLETLLVSRLIISFLDLFSFLFKVTLNGLIKDSLQPLSRYCRTLKTINNSKHFHLEKSGKQQQKRLVESRRIFWNFFAETSSAKSRKSSGCCTLNCVYRSRIMGALVESINNNAL